MSKSAVHANPLPSAQLKGNSGVRISGVIHTFNEEKNIANSIRSLLPWTDEVIVIDMHSEDATREIAAELGAQVVLHERLNFADPAREFGISQTRGEWIIALDADEMVPISLAFRLREIAEKNEADVVMIFLLSYIMGVPFSGGGWGLHYDAPPRFFKRGTVTFPPFVHSRHKLAPDARELKLEPVEDYAIVHFNYIDAHHVLSKFNRYTTLEAEGRHTRGIRTSTFSTLTAAARSFVARYFYRRGYREGWRGLFMCALMVMYEISSFAKLKEIEDQERNGPVPLRYTKVAEELLSRYADGNGPDPDAAVHTLKPRVRSL